MLACVCAYQVELTARGAPEVVTVGLPFEVEWRVFNKSDRVRQTIPFIAPGPALMVAAGLGREGRMAGCARCAAAEAAVVKGRSDAPNRCLSGRACGGRARGCARAAVGGDPPSLPLSVSP